MYLHIERKRKITNYYTHFDVYKCFLFNKIKKNLIKKRTSNILYQKAKLSPPMFEVTNTTS